jgi:hypothetical protein
MRRSSKNARKDPQSPIESQRPRITPPLRLIPRSAFLLMTGLFLVLVLTACGNKYQTNPLGYNYVVSQFGSTKPSARLPMPAVTPPAQPNPLLKQAGMGNTLDTFLTHYAHAMRNENVEEVVADLVGENGATLQATLMNGGRTSRRGSERGKT